MLKTLVAYIVENFSDMVWDACATHIVGWLLRASNNVWLFVIESSVLSFAVNVLGGAQC